MFGKLLVLFLSQPSHPTTNTSFGFVPSSMSSATSSTTLQNSRDTVMEAYLEALKQCGSGEGTASRSSELSTPTADVPPRPLSGHQIDKYLLCRDPNESTSGKSVIYDAYEQCEETGKPLSNTPLVVKVSPNQPALEREAQNYDLITRHDNRESFVGKLDYFPCINGSSIGDQQDKAAIVLEKGQQDLRQFLHATGPLQGDALCHVALQTAYAVKAVHEADMVWTEVKAENFVVDTQSDNDSKRLSIKGIDLESAVPLASTPIDFTPEAMPPEFATAVLCGREPYHAMLPSLDMWSLGMVLYEMTHGQPYYANKVDHGTDITHYLHTTQKHDVLPQPRANSPLHSIIQSCLQVDANRRPSIDQIVARLS